MIQLSSSDGGSTDSNLQDDRNEWGGVDYLRSEELWRAAEGACPVAVSHALFAQAEVGDLDVPLRVQQQVIQLQVPANKDG